MNAFARQRAAQIANTMPTTALAALVAVALVVAIFPDVIFHGANISNLGAYRAATYDLNKVELYPERPRRSYHHGLNDAGGAMWQSEPMQQFMTWVFRHAESPYWNPYSGAGSLGPETLVDQKFSPFTILIALGGGSTAVYHLVILSLYVLAVFFLFLTLTKFLALSRLAAFAACIVYMLNGYNIANLGSNVSQVYLYFPVCLFALCAFAEKPSAGRLIALVGANVPVLATTFLPTTLLMLLAAYAIGASYAIALASPHGAAAWSRTLAVIGFQGAAATLAFLLLSFLYFPILESFAVVDPMSMYKARIFYPVNISNLLSFFSPKHFWESYNAIDPTLWSPASPAHIGNVAFHFGIVPAIVASAAFSARSGGYLSVLVGAAGVLFVSLARLFDVPGISDVIGEVLVLGSVGAQYWWTAVAVAFPILVAYGLDSLASKCTRWAPIVLIYLVIGACLVYTGLLYDVPGIRLIYAIVCVVVLLLLAASSGVIIYLGADGRILSLQGSRALLVFLIFAELTFYMNHLRFVRTELFADPPQEIRFLRNNLGEYRIVNYGWTGVPPELGSAYQLAQLGSMNMNILPRYLDFYKRVFVPDPSQRWGDFATLHNVRDEPNVNETILDLMGVKYILIPATWKNHAAFFESRGYPRVLETPYVVLLENLDCYPRMFAVPTLVDAPLTPDTADLSPRKVAFTQDPRLMELGAQLGVQLEVDSDLSWGVNSLIGDEAVTLEDYHNAHLKAKVRLPVPAVVVLMDNWHPAWRAYVDGDEVYVGIVNESFRGMVLPPGEHTIEMRYAPATLSIALAVSCAVLALMLVMIFARRYIDAFLRRFRSLPSPQHETGRGLPTGRLDNGESPIH